MLGLVIGLLLKCVKHKRSLLIKLLIVSGILRQLSYCYVRSSYLSSVSQVVSNLGGTSDSLRDFSYAGLSDGNYRLYFEIESPYTENGLELQPQNGESIKLEATKYTEWSCAISKRQL